MEAPDPRRLEALEEPTEQALARLRADERRLRVDHGARERPGALGQRVEHHQRPARPEPRECAREAALGLGHGGEREAEDDGVERAARREVARVGVDPLDVAPTLARAALPPALDHALRHVDGDHGSVRGDARPQVRDQRAKAAAEVEDRPARASG
jgi:hypothetical protein